MPTLYAFLEKDMPRIDIEVENPFFFEDRSRRRFAELLAELEREYDHMREILEALGAGPGIPRKQVSPEAHTVSPSSL